MRAVRLEAGPSDLAPLVGLDAMRSNASRAVSSMPDERRSALALAHVSGVSYREIARQLGITEEMVLTHLREGLATIRQHVVAEVSRSSVDGAATHRPARLARRVLACFGRR